MLQNILIVFQDNLPIIRREALQEIINEQKLSFKATDTIDRQLKIPERSKAIQVISGIRRYGKSTLVKRNFLTMENAIYLNFEDPRLINFELTDFYRLEELLTDKQNGYLLLDEIQNIEKWELYARAGHDKKIKMKITSSNANAIFWLKKMKR